MRCAGILVKVPNPGQSIEAFCWFYKFTKYWPGKNQWIEEGIFIEKTVRKKTWSLIRVINIKLKRAKIPALFIGSLSNHKF